MLDKENTIIIELHTPGSDDAKIWKLLKQFDLQYPIAIDMPAEKLNAWGENYADYAIYNIPHAVLIDREGKRESLRFVLSAALILN